MHFQNQTVYITGASSGIGRELAGQLAAKGARLALFARRQDELEATAAAAKTAGSPQVDIYPSDITDRQAVRAAMAAAAERTGACDVLFLNAGIEIVMNASRFDAGKIEKIYAVNVLGPSYCLEAVLPGMLAAKRGCIVGISSLSAYMAMPGMYPYASSKAAFSSMLEGLRLEVRSRGVQVLTMCPGYIDTPMTSSHAVWMPMMLKVQDAVQRMVRATERGTEVYNFPAAMALFMKNTKTFLPPRVLAWGWQKMLSTGRPPA